MPVSAPKVQAGPMLLTSKQLMAHTRPWLTVAFCSIIALHVMHALLFPVIWILLCFACRDGVANALQPLLDALGISYLSLCSSRGHAYLQPLQRRSHSDDIPSIPLHSEVLLLAQSWGLQSCSRKSASNAEWLQLSYCASRLLQVLTCEPERFFSHVTDGLPTFAHCYQTHWSMIQVSRLHAFLQ